MANPVNHAPVPQAPEIQLNDLSPSPPCDSNQRLDGARRLSKYTDEGFSRQAMFGPGVRMIILLSMIIQCFNSVVADHGECTWSSYRVVSYSSSIPH
jgi:hypothetical protein